jgi:hypothetical protein
MARSVSVIPVTIASGQSLSGVGDLRGYQLVGISFPAGWTAADVTLQTAADPDDTYLNVFYGTTELTIDAAADQHTVIDPDSTAGLGSYVKVRSGPAGAAVNQAADRIIKLIAIAD